MRPVLDQLNVLPGVLGSMRCDAEGTPIAHALPRTQLDGNLREAAAAAAESLRGLRAATGTATHLDLRHGDRRLVVVPDGEEAVVLVCDKSADPRRLVPAVEEVLRRAASAAALLASVRDGAAPPQVHPVPAWRQVPVIAGAAVAAVLLVGLTVWAALRGGPDAPGSGAPGAAPGAVTLLRVGGAKAFAAELAPALARAYLQSVGVEDPKVEALEAYRFTVSGRRGEETWAVEIEGMNTPDGFDRLGAGTLDVAMSGRRIKPEWQAKLDAFGPMTVPGREHVVALSGIAVVVNPANLVPQLGRAELAAIFAGEVTDWSELGGPRRVGPSPIHLYMGDERMGLPELFRTLVMGKAPYAPAARRLATLQEITDAVALDPQGIGFVTLPFVRGARAVPVSEEGEAPLVPTAFTLATEDYFLTHRLFFYALPRPERPHLGPFVQFALGPAGQEVVRQSGYVELSVATAPRDAPPGAPAEYLRLTEGARRLSSTFRFEPASAEFDTRALVDLERVTTYLVENRVNGAAVRVLGFADAQGRPEVNLGLSVARAEQVAKAFAQRGIAGIAVSGFGSALPVASNRTPDGRQRNRRVEVWIAR